ncbi:MAG TPA: leucyl aminopeptidase [Aeromicrobium sp.]|nr:leucyl aminopeptidase [Aeromicrobium sp.]
MVTVSLSNATPATARVAAVVVGMRSDAEPGPYESSLSALNFSGEKDQCVTFPGGGATRAGLVVAVALPEAPTADQLRKAAAIGVRAAVGAKAATVGVAMQPESAEQVGAIAEGIALGAYEFTTYKTKAKTTFRSATILTTLNRQPAARAAVARAEIVADSVAQARDWVNTPPADLRPPVFADAIKAFAADATKVTVWDERRLDKERCGGILAVGAGSSAPPRLVRLEYKPSNAKVHLALVGKGITFDSGGLSIKTGVGMQTMKIDMAGAAAVVGATAAIARLGLPIRITAIACLAENMPSGDATRPGDILTIRNGATVEVLNTDAEGRLVLADGLALAAEAKPNAIVDAATLTGACIVALGDRTAGLMSNDDAVTQQVLEAAARSGEPVWPLPIPDEIADKVTTSKVADLRQHNPKAAGGALFAAAFLSKFVDGRPWAHIDLAGPAFNEEGPYGYTPAGGTGFGVRTLVELAEVLSQG